MRILITNDDGIDAPGLQTLIHVLKDQHELCVIAPNEEQSGKGHAISLHEPLKVTDCSTENYLAYRVVGTPADCVKIGIAEIPDFYPDFLISGINQGSNTGVSVYYSGTIAAAREGQINRIPSMAISLCSKTSQDFRASVDITEKLLRAFEASILKKDMLLNVNVPPVPMEEIKGAKWVKQADSRFIEEFILREEKVGEKNYDLRGYIDLFSKQGDSDEEVMKDGYIAITPLIVDMTDYRMIEGAAAWDTLIKEVN